MLVFVEFLLWLCNGASIHEYRKDFVEQVMQLMRRQHAFIRKRKTVRVRVEGISDFDMLRSVLASYMPPNDAGKVNRGTTETRASDTFGKRLGEWQSRSTRMTESSILVSNLGGYTGNHVSATAFCLSLGGLPKVLSHCRWRG